MGEGVLIRTLFR